MKKLLGVALVSLMLSSCGNLITSDEEIQSLSSSNITNTNTSESITTSQTIESSIIDNTSPSIVEEDGVKKYDVSFNIDNALADLSVWTDYDINGSRAAEPLNISQKDLTGRHSIDYDYENGTGRYLFAIDENGYIVYATYGLRAGYGGPNDGYYYNSDSKDPHNCDYFSLHEKFGNYPDMVQIDGEMVKSWRLYDLLIPQNGFIISGYYTESKFADFWCEITNMSSVPTNSNNTLENTIQKKELDKYYISINEQRKLQVQIRSDDQYIKSTPSKQFVSNEQDSYIDYSKSGKNIDNYLGSDDDVYRINIETDDNVFPEDKITYVSGELSITEQDTSKVKMSKQSMGVKLRGNSTLAAIKKPFRIKFDEKQSLFGLPKAKSWVLLANYYDKSSVRNYLAYLTANKMRYLDFQPSSIFVDVYFNNEYQGLYLLCEQMQTGNGRVDIEDIKDGTLNSFMIELDERAPQEGQINYDYFKVGNNNYAFKYPDVEDIDRDNMFWIIDFMRDASNAILRNENYEDYIDVNSFIDYYIVEEFFKNADVGSTSQYYYISQDDKKLRCGPVWDFDIALNVINADNQSCYEKYENTDLFVRERDTLYSALFNDEDFLNRVKARYKQLSKDIIPSIFEEYENVKEKLSKAQLRNTNKWEIPGEVDVTFIEQSYSNLYKSFTTLDEHYDFVSTQLSERLQIMNTAYLY